MESLLDPLPAAGGLNSPERFVTPDVTRLGSGGGSLGRLLRAFTFVISPAHKRRHRLTVTVAVVHPKVLAVLPLLSDQPAACNRAKGSSEEGKAVIRSSWLQCKTGRRRLRASFGLPAAARCRPGAGSPEPRAGPPVAKHRRRPRGARTAQRRRDRRAADLAGSRGPADRLLPAALAEWLRGPAHHAGARPTGGPPALLAGRRPGPGRKPAGAFGLFPLFQAVFVSPCREL
jgi:hypothetical protein